MGEAPPDDPLIGTMVQRYRLSRLLGAGGMGRVYEAEHPEVGARVAVKVLTSEEQDSVARFFAEARAVNLIRHEGIVDILDLTHLPDGRPCIIMEYLEGASLQVLLSGGAMGLGTTCRLTIQILDALGAAHEHGILHRDLKPDNIFVSPSGRATLVDFGVAKLSSGTTVRTEAGIVVGTVPYMSPEQAMDEPLDPRSDLFSIGVVLYEACCGARPFAGDNVFVVRKEHSQGPVRPRVLRADMPERLEELILRALAVDRDLRFQTASAMTTAIEEVCVELPSGAFTPIVVPGSRLSITIPALSPTQVSRTAATSLERPRQRAAQQLVTAATALERPPLPRAGGPIAEAPRSDRSPLVRARYLAVIAIVAAVSIGLTYSLLGASGGGGDPSVELHDPPPNWRPPKLDFYADAQALVHGSDHQIRSQYERAGSLSLGPAVKEARSKVRAVLPDSELAGLTVVLAGGSPANVTMFFDSPSAMKTGKLCRMMVNVSSTVAYVHEPTRIGCRGAIPVPRCPVAQVLRYNLGKGRPRLLYYGPGGWWILNGQAQQAVGRPPC